MASDREIAKPLRQVYPSEVHSLDLLLLAGEAFVKARQLAEQRELTFDERRYNAKTPRLAMGKVLVQKLGGSCLIATPEGFNNQRWHAAITMAGDNQFFIGNEISLIPTDPRQYGRPITGIEDTLPRLRINRLAPDGHLPTEPYEMLVTQAEFESLYVAQLSVIDEVNRFYPFANWQPNT